MEGSNSKEDFGPSTADFKATIQYCCGWGYKSKATVAKDYLLKEFGDKIYVVLIPDDEITGNLEIVLFNNKTGDSKRIHSKRNGDGIIFKNNYTKFLDKVKNFMEE